MRVQSTALFTDSLNRVSDGIADRVKYNWITRSFSCRVLLLSAGSTYRLYNLRLAVQSRKRTLTHFSEKNYS